MRACAGAAQERPAGEERAPEEGRAAADEKEAGRTAPHEEVMGEASEWLRLCVANVFGSAHAQHFPRPPRRRRPSCLLIVD